ncbi:flavin-binding monooxygenase [Penicillium lividum]|nr:flavin-binding monooxygenase [Penicillium lividum]
MDHRTLGSIYQPQRKLKVICVGAGASGLLLAYKIQRHFDDFELKVFEKNPDVSGTWFENRYPGCACDVPSHCYTWSFEPKTDWSANYATAKEIFGYFKDFAARHALEKFIEFQHEVVGAQWDDATGEWTVQVKNNADGTIKTDSAHVLINAGGILNAWRYPTIPGIQSYKGTLVHSAAWPEDLDLSGKVVGLIGNGSSGIQILPAIKSQVKELVTFIREATWIAPPIGQEYHAYTPEEKERFKEDSRMKEKLQNPELEKLLIPEWAAGCPRLTPGTNYLESLSDPKVKVVYGEITQITETGVICDNGAGENPVDVLICATGFDTTFKPQFSLVNGSGEDLRDLGQKEPAAYLGITVDKFPNYVFTLGPNSPVSNGPVLIAIEAQVEYIIKMLSKCQKENLKSFSVTSDAVKDFNTWKDDFTKDTSEFKLKPLISSNIHADAFFQFGPKNAVLGTRQDQLQVKSLHFVETLKEPRWEDWEFARSEKTRNRFTYLGNGHSSAEGLGGDLSYHIRNKDDSPVDPILKKSKLCKE